jgi:uncharacterized protein (DUF1778 family)
MNITTVTDPEPVARLSCRVSRRIKQRAEEAAALLGQSITDFTETALSEKAEAVLANLQRIQLSERDFERFVAAVTTPAPPTPELIAAMQEYERQRAQEPEGNW